MKDAKTPSVSAAAVAMMRGAAQYLPAPMNTLAPDDVSWRLAGFTLLPAFFATFPRLAKLFLYLAPKMAVWTTIRTRLIDDALLSFIEMGGKQHIVIMGAGFDSRAIRLAPKLDGATVFEVDSPGSQLQKRAAVARLFPSAVAGKGDPAGEAGLRFVAQDFEHEPIDSLPDALRREGLDNKKPTFVLLEGARVLRRNAYSTNLTNLEGVVEYLTPEAVDATVRVARKLGGARSRLVVEYVQPSTFRVSWLHRATVFAWFRTAGESFRFMGWEAGALDGYLAARSWKLLSNESTLEAAARLNARPVKRVVTHIGVAEAV